MKYKLGIDPGISGALALLDENNTLVDIADMPVMRLGKNKHKQQVNAAELTKIIRAWKSLFKARGIALEAYLELVSAMPKQGVTSMFNFGVSLGVIEGVLAALSIPVYMVTPASWKKRAGLTGKDKEAARTLAQQLYPAAELGMKKHIGRADAILIARYGGKE
jgi:crossover junction endodeoxyribonuclease RuvC